MEYEDNTYEADVRGVDGKTFVVGAKQVGVSWKDGYRTTINGEETEDGKTHECIHDALKAGVEAAHDRKALKQG
jgi:hypothetical protein